MLNKFFSSNLYTTDVVCTEYADHMLWKNCFIFSRARKDDPNVIAISTSSLILW